MSRKVFLGGEGPNELGSWGSENSASNDTQTPGVLEVLLQRTQPTGWVIAGGVQWKDISKYMVGGHGSADRRNVLRLALMAREKGCDIVAFSRDRDNDLHRGKVIEDALDELKVKDLKIEVIGGVAIRSLEAWILALQGRTKTEQLGTEKLKAALEEANIPEKSTEAFVQIAREAKLESLPKDATSLRQWLQRARDVLTPPNALPKKET